MRHPLITHYLCLPYWPGLGQPAKGPGRVLVSCPVPPFRGQDTEAQAWLGTSWTTPKKKEKAAWLPPKVSLKLPGTDYSFSVAERLGKERNKLKVATLPKRLNTWGREHKLTAYPVLVHFRGLGDTGQEVKEYGMLAGWLHRTAVRSGAGLECRAESFR